MCLDSALQWWLRLLGVFPVCDSEPGRFSASSLVTTVPVTPCRIACFPFGTVTFITAASPAHCLLTEVEQPVRQGSGPGRGACAPSRTRQRNHLAAQTKQLCENLPEPLKTREKPGFWQDLQAGWREVPWNRRTQLQATIMAHLEKLREQFTSARIRLRPEFSKKARTVA